jgi:hypothetical protein
MDYSKVRSSVGYRLRKEKQKLFFQHPINRKTLLPQSGNMSLLDKNAGFIVIGLHQIW